MTDLKEVLMHLGNKLVTEHGYNPAVTGGVLDTNAESTLPIKLFTVWMNKHPAAQQALRELGFSWAMPKERGISS